MTTLRAMRHLPAPLLTRVLNRFMHDLNEELDAVEVSSDTMTLYKCKSGRMVYYTCHGDEGTVKLTYHKSSEEHPDGEGGIIKMVDLAGEDECQAFITAPQNTTK